MPLSHWSLKWARADLGKSGTAENPAERQGEPSVPEVKRRVTDSLAAPTAAAPLFLFFPFRRTPFSDFRDAQTALLASLWGIFNEFFIDCKAARYYRRRSFSEAFTQTTSKRTVSGPIVLYPSRCAVGSGGGGNDDCRVLWPIIISDSTEASHYLFETRSLAWKGKRKSVQSASRPGEHAAIFLHLPVGNFPRGLPGLCSRWY